MQGRSAKQVLTRHRPRNLRAQNLAITPQALPPSIPPPIPQNHHYQGLQGYVAIFYAAPDDIVPVTWAQRIEPVP